MSDNRIYTAQSGTGRKDYERTGSGNWDHGVGRSETGSWSLNPTRAITEVEIAAIDARMDEREMTIVNPGDPSRA